MGGAPRREDAAVWGCPLRYEWPAVAAVRAGVCHKQRGNAGHVWAGALTGRGLHNGPMGSGQGAAARCARGGVDRAAGSVRGRVRSRSVDSDEPGARSVPH